MTDTFQWERCASDGTGCADIGGATAAAYTLTSGDVGHKIRVRGTRDGTLVGESAPVGPVLATAPPASGYPNRNGPFGQAAPDWATPANWRGDSASLIALLHGAVTSAVLAVAGYGIAYYEAASGDPTVTVTNTNGWGTAPGVTSFKCPASARPAAGSDEHMVVKQLDGSYLEMWHAVRVAGGNFTAGAVAVAAAGDYSYSVAGCRGSSFTLMSGVVVPGDIPAGDHALCATLPSSCVSRAHVSPSTASDGTLSTGIPEGSLICLDPAVSIAGLDAVTRACAEMLQGYGMFVADKTGGGQLEIDALDPLSFTSVGQPDAWAAIGVSGYPSLNGLAALIPHMRVAVPA